MTGSNHNAVSMADREIISTRVLDAPRELVFRVFSEPEHLAQWRGQEEIRKLNEGSGASDMQGKAVKVAESEAGAERMKG